MSETWITPGRHTRLVLDITSPIALLAWLERRRGPQITAAPGTARVQLQPGNGWTLKPLNEDLSRLISSDWETGGGALGIRGEDVNLGPHWQSVLTYRKPTDLTGIDAAVATLSTASPAFYKRVAAGADWDSTLTADVAAVPQPVLESADIPMDRVLSSLATYPRNTGFMLVMRIPPGFTPADTYATLYLGGPNEVDPSGQDAGSFCVVLRGSGKAQLFEKDGATWEPRFEWNAFGAMQGNLATVGLKIFPYGRDTIALTGGNIDGVAGGFTLFGLLATLATLGMRAGQGSFRTFYRSTRGKSGYIPLQSITGVGSLRLDVRRDLRTYLQIVRLRPPEDGTLIDLPFWIPFPIAEGTPIRVSDQSFRPTGTQISVKLHNADDDVELTTVGANTFASHAGQQAYYAKFTFTADTNKEQTPVLWSYQVDVPSQVSELAPVSVTGGVIRSVSATGPDLDPTAMTAQVMLEDPLNVMPLLRARGRIPGRVMIYDDAAALITVLHEGEVSLAPALKRGKPGRVYPSPFWHQYDVSMVGPWARLADAIALDLVDFSEDTDAAPDENGQYPTWKVTDIIRFLLERLGYTSAQLDIPDIDIRLFFVVGTQLEEFLLQPGASPAEFIRKLCEQYLAMTLIWDGNAGATGMWRLLYNKTAPTPIVAEFLGGPTVSGRLPMHPNSYAVGEAPILHESYREEVRAPEANFIMVIGADMSIPAKQGYSMYNPISFDFLGATSDPLHIDYLGRFVPLVHVDPTLSTLEAAAFMCRRIYNFAAHGTKWLKWRAPLIFITDPTDPLQTRVRPLRVQDAVTVFGQPAIIRSCNPSYTHDGLQLADHEALAV